MSKPVTLAKIENGEVVEQAILGKDGWQPPQGETWLPIVVETPDYNRATHREVRRENRIEADRVVRVRIIEPIEVTADMIKAECQRRIIAYTGGGDLLGSLAKQLNAGGAMQGEIDRLRARSNAIEAMSPVPINFRDDEFWA